MKTVDILITNHNAGDTIALCIESIRKYTDYPHGIIVYDDATDPAQYDDLIYLREAQRKGWIRLIEGECRIMHGKSIARLLDETKADLAMILDCDIEITTPNWLARMADAQKATDACLISDIVYLANSNVNISSWFFMLDTAQYPAIKAEWCYTPMEGGGPGDIRPTGYRIWENIMKQGRKIVPIPNEIRQSFIHHIHMSVLSLPKEGETYAVWLARYAVVQANLSRLRRQG